MKLLPLILFAIILPLAGNAPQQQATSVTLPQCTQGQHDGYAAYGPDGVLYPTWHPRIDAYYGCYYDHEHGSSPGLLAPADVRRTQPSLKPVYGYTAGKHGMSEGHVGFKTYVFQHGQYRWMWTHHFGTADKAASICRKMHTVDVVGVDVTTLEKVADLHLMLNFGPAATVGAFTPYTPAGCPTQFDDPQTTHGRRSIPSATESPQYQEAWNVDGRLLSAVGFSPGGLYLITVDPQMICNDLTCSANVPGESSAGGAGRGTLRTIRFGPYGPGFWFTGAKSGTFYTDPMGKVTRQASDPDAVQQYIKPGFVYAFPAGLPTCAPDGMTQMYWCTTVLQNTTPVQLDPFATGPN